MFGLVDYLKIGCGVAAGLVLYHLYAVSIGYPQARDEAREGYVLLAEKTAAEATAKELLRQRDAAMAANQMLQDQIARDAAHDAVQEKDREDAILQYEIRLSQANRRCALDRSDIDSILREP